MLGTRDSRIFFLWSAIYLAGGNVCVVSLEVNRV